MFSYAHADSFLDILIGLQNVPSVYSQVNTYRPIQFAENDFLRELLFPGKLVLIWETGTAVILL